MPESPHTTGRPGDADGAGDRLIRVGVVITGLGIVLTAVAMLPLATDIELPSAFWWLSMLTGVGLAVVLVGLARNGRRRSRLQLAARISAD